MSADIEISEVGLRDGLQGISPIMPTEAKKAWKGWWSPCWCLTCAPRWSPCLWIGVPGSKVLDYSRHIWGLLGLEKRTGIHLHNTRGQGLANVMAALPAVELYGFTPDAGLPKDFKPATVQ